MPYNIEVLATREDIYAYLEDAFFLLNQVQKEIIFSLPPDRLRKNASTFYQQSYKTNDIWEWLRKYRQDAKGTRPYLLLVVDGYLSSDTKGNLFGSHNAEEGLAVFTINTFDHFVNDGVRFCRYYLVRYALSFLAPEIKTHETRGCMFDNKNYKKDLLISLTTGNLCSECQAKLNTKLNLESTESFRSFSKIIAGQYPYALVMKGGGVKGLALAGAMLELERYFTFDTFAGTSAGAMAAVLLGSGYKAKELLDILKTKDLSDFKDANLLEGLLNIVSQCGFYPGKTIATWLDDLISKKIVPKQIGYIKLKALQYQTILYASRDREASLIFDSKGERQDIIASFAARCSMSIPYVFIPQKMENIRVYDGGIRNNFPLAKFIEKNQNKPFVGLYIQNYEKRSRSMICELFNITQDGDEWDIVDSNIKNIVLIETHPISTLNFNLTSEKKQFLVLAGRIGALNYLKVNYPDFNINQSLIDDLSVKQKKLKL